MRQKFIYQKLIGAPKNVEIDPFLDHIGHLGELWLSFLSFEVLTDGIIKSKTHLVEFDQRGTLGWPFWNSLVAILYLAGGGVFQGEWRCRCCEQVPRRWYF